METNGVEKISSVEEQAELEALFAFPNNPRDAELFTKQKLGTLSPEEQAELEGFFDIEFTHLKY